ncbi:MAG: prepilin-type N-terminal cleavage/methylation domain-containing protein [bacterium]|nr:prepilin-type N-terminal cleavage/methylation domain-containing protein [bacterium]
MRYLTNHKGMTLTELLVAMAISGVVLVAIVSATIFLQRYLAGWEKQDILSEELAFLAGELEKSAVQASDIGQFQDSLVINTSGRQITYSWKDGIFMRNGIRFGRSGVSVTALALHEFGLRTAQADSILSTNGITDPHGLYRLRIVVTSRGEKSDSLISILRNDHVYFKLSSH